VIENFAFIKKPDSTWAVGRGRALWSAKRPVGGPAFYAPDFFLSDPEPWLCFEQMEIWSDERWRSELGLRQQVEIRFESLAADHFLRRTEALLREIEAGGLSKAVPVEFETAENAAVNWRSFLPALPMVSGLFPYGFWTDGEAMLGVSPEILLQVKDDHVETMALAGTGRLEDPSLLENPKEVEEHRLVIQDIAQNLSVYGEVMVGRTEERLLPSLKHLHTAIGLRLHKRANPEEMIRRLHPTAALGGFPREAASTWLQKQPEAGCRRRFGAPFAYIDENSAFAVVAIRNLQKHSGKLWLGAGCGVVRGSIPSQEWAELTLKRNSVRRALGLSPETSL